MYEIDEEETPSKEGSELSSQPRSEIQELPRNSQLEGAPFIVLAKSKSEITPAFRNTAFSAQNLTDFALFDILEAKI